MYIRTERALVNLADKDIVITRWYDDKEYLVMAHGPAAGFDNVTESGVRTQLELFRGTEAECLDYLAMLQASFSSLPGLEVIDGSWESVTGLESPTDTVVSGNGAGIVYPEDRVDDGIPF